MSITPPLDPASQVHLADSPGSLAAGLDGPAGGQVVSGKPRSILVRGWEVFAENRMALVSLGILVLVTLFCFAGPLIYHTNQVNTDLSDYICRPSSQHLLGCNDLGFDEIGRLMLGGQASLEVGVAAALVACAFGTLYGAFSGFIGGAVDAALMRFVDAGLSIPGLLLLIILSVIFHPGRLVMIFIIAVFYWMGVARLVRGETLTLRTREYVQAVKVMGGSGSRAVIRHIVPNAIGTIIVQATFAIADSILTLAGLGFLGFGIQLPGTDWGTMLSNGMVYINDGYWWLIYPPGLIIIVTVMTFNFIGDALRDAFETRLQRR